MKHGDGSVQAKQDSASSTNVQGAGNRPTSRVPAEKTVNSNSSPSSKPLTGMSKYFHHRNYRQLLTAAGLVLLVLANLGLLAWSLNSRTGSSNSVSSPSLSAVRGPRPSVPSLPGLDLNTPVPVPGLEAVDPAFAPALTPDWNNLVFAGAGKSKGDYDLYVSSRGSPRLPFSSPMRIESCSSGTYETFPTLSPDGLELIFLRFESPPRLWYSRRATVNEQFGRPMPWPMGVEIPSDRRVGGAQFIDLEHIQFVMRGKSPADRREILIRTRPGPASPFGTPTPLQFTKAPVPQFVNSSRLRTYYGAPEGLFLAARDSESDSFGVPVKILNLVAEGPVWVAPQEDVIVFSAPKPGDKVKSSRKLWMIRF